MLGSGFIGRFYADSIQGLRSKDKIVSIYSRREESAKKFAADYGCAHWTTDMEESIAHPAGISTCWLMWARKILLAATVVVAMSSNHGSSSPSGPGGTAMHGLCRSNSPPSLGKTAGHENFMARSVTEP